MTTPCFYCELDRAQSCKVCIHGEADMEELKEMKNGAMTDIAAERERQKSVEGWTPEHDDEHADRSMARVAACYLHHYIARQWLTEEPDGLRQYQSEELPDDWPMSWHEDWWKPKNPRRDLVRAAALIAAEIDRMDRVALAHKGAQGEKA